MNILLDTNILLRITEPGHAQHQPAVDATDRLGQQGHALTLVPQNYYEYWVVSTRPTAQNGRGKTPDDVLAEVGFLDTHFAVLGDVPALLDEWKQVMAAYKVTGKPAHDARLVAAMLVHGLTHLLTFNDADFRRYAGITPLNPAGVLALPP